jgi:hypothetical protein
VVNDESGRVHPCLCGFTCEKYWQMKVHRETCDDWKKRADPMGVMIDRRRKTRAENPETARKFAPCTFCRRRPDHHASGCPNSQSEAVRRDSVRRHGIDPFDFEAFLRLLGREYER